MKRITAKIRPTSGFAHIFHLIFIVILPILLFILVRIHFAQLAIALVLLSKWRMFAVRPRHWLANLKANAADIIVGLATVVFMAQTQSVLLQLIWAVAYALWLILVKPSSTLFGISIQALITSTYGLMAVFLALGDASSFWMIVATWAVCYIAARHFFTSFDEPYARFLAHTWALFGASLTWLLSHWLLFYGFVAQPTLLLTVLGFSLATLYYLEKTERLSVLIRRQFLFVMLAIIIVVLIFSDWGDKTV